MNNTEELVNERTRWEDLNNIQIFSGNGNFTFAFKKLNKKNEIGRLFYDILSNDGTSEFTFEPDFFFNYYYDYRSNNLLCYDSMTEEFYLRKIYHYARCTVRQFDDNSILEFEKVVERASQNQVYSKLLNNMLEIKIINRRSSVAKIPPEELKEEIKRIKNNKSVFQNICSKEDMKILELFYETKTFDRGKGICIFSII